MLKFEGHAIVSADGMIADANGDVPPTLRNEADWRQYQQALDRSAVVVTGRRGHERFPNPGRRRLVLTRSVEKLAPDPRDPKATFWNPSGLNLRAALGEIGISSGTVAITGVFEQFLADYTSFMLSEMPGLVIPDGIPCFSLGHPRAILTHAGLRPAQVELIDPANNVTTTLWSRSGQPPAE